MTPSCSQADNTPSEKYLSIIKSLASPGSGNNNLFAKIHLKIIIIASFRIKIPSIHGT
jgi:hypothetical protein